MEEEKKEEKTFQTELIEKTEQAIKTVVEQGLNNNNIDFLYKAVDIHKDLCNENYWKAKEEYYMYGNYDDMSYGRRGVRGTGRGRYSEGSYGRRGVPGTGRGRYRGEEMLDEMSYHYGNYHNSGNYGAKEDSAYKMTEAFKEFGFSIAEELEPNEKMMFKQAMQEIMQELER